MRGSPIMIFAALLALGGCVPPPCGPYSNCYAPAQYAPPAYAPPVYAPPPYAAVPPPPLEPPDGYTPDYGDGGAAFLFVPERGGWGYYDRDRHWRGAPPGVRERLEREHPGGPPPGAIRGGPGFGGNPPGRPPPGGPGPAGYQGRPGGGFPDRPHGPPGGPPPPRPPPGPPPHRPCGPGQPGC